jgi:hypothetical protein
MPRRPFLPDDHVRREGTGRGWGASDNLAGQRYAGIDAVFRAVLRKTGKLRRGAGAVAGAVELRRISQRGRSHKHCKGCDQYRIKYAEQFIHRQLDWAGQPVGWVERRRNPSPFAKEGAVIGAIARPIQRINAERDPSVERRVRPVPHLGRVPALDRAEMNIIEVPRKVVFVSQRVSPTAPLPDPAFPL